MTRSAPVVVKVSGDLLRTTETAPNLLGLRAERALVLVVGFGVQLSTWMEERDFAVRFRDGRRVTTEEVLPGVRTCAEQAVETAADVISRDLGREALDLSSAVAARPADDAALGRAGRVEHVDKSPLLRAIGRGSVPIVAPSVTDSNGNGLNVNADELAADVAIALGASRLVFCTWFPGVLDSSGNVIDEMTPTAALELVNQGVARTGMAFKLRQAARAACAGCSVRIVAHDLTDEGTLLRGRCRADDEEDPG